MFGLALEALPGVEAEVESNVSGGWLSQVGHGKS
jgi:hypothetical protein